MNLKQAKGLVRALEQASQGANEHDGDYRPPTAQVLEDDHDLEVLLVTESHRGLLFWVDPLGGNLLDSCNRTVEVCVAEDGSAVLRPIRGGK